MDEEGAEPGGLHIQDGRPRGRSIIRAAETGDLSTIETMIGRVPSLTDYTDEHGQTALMWASYKGHLSVVMYLLDQDAAIDIVDHDGRTALFMACDWNQSKVVTLLLERGADASITSNIGETPLMAACWSADGDSARRLLSLGTVDVDAMDQQGRSALWEACRCDSAELVEMLLRAGADADACGKDGKGPRDAAAHSGSTQCMDRLEDEKRRYLTTRARRLHQASTLARSDPHVTKHDMPLALQQRFTSCKPLPQVSDVRRQPLVRVRHAHAHVCALRRLLLSCCLTPLVDVVCADDKDGEEKVELKEERQAQVVGHVVKDMCLDVFIRFGEYIP